MRAEVCNALLESDAYFTCIYARWRFCDIRQSKIKLFAINIDIASNNFNLHIIDTHTYTQNTCLGISYINLYCDNLYSST